MPLSFIYLCDGSVASKDFRPQNDEGAWWARRDSMARITSLSLYAGRGEVREKGGPITESITFLFAPTSSGTTQDWGDQAKSSPADSSSSGANDTKKRSHTSTCSSNDENEDVEYAALCMLGGASSGLLDHVKVPTERGLVTAWKLAAARAEKGKTRPGALLLLGGRGDAHVDAEDAVVVVAQPSQEAALLPYHNAQHTNASHNTSKRHKGQTHHKEVSAIGANVHDDNEGGFDKRQQLRLLQSQCPLEFLKEHGLAGSEVLILRKRNRGHIEAARAAWLQLQSSTNPENIKSSTRLAEYGDNENKATKLQLTVEVLIYRQITLILQKGINPLHLSISLLFLHENYTDELPVFGQKSNSNSNITASDETGDTHIVIVVLGAVRDARAYEYEQIALAAQNISKKYLSRSLFQNNNTVTTNCIAQRVAIRGCNLGRTSEFTSKIVASFIGHCLHDKYAMSRAVHSLPLLSCSSTQDSPVPSQATNTTVQASDQAIIPQVNLHYCIWLPVAPRDITTDLDKRDSLHSLVQLIVCTLWRSRLASGNTDTSDNASDKDHENGRAIVRPVLHLVFVDDDSDEISLNANNKGERNRRVRTIALSQEAFTLRMARMHWAAPTEYQVLSTLCAILKEVVFTPTISTTTIVDSSSKQISKKDAVLATDLGNVTDSDIIHHLYHITGGSKTIAHDLRDVLPIGCSSSSFYNDRSKILHSVPSISEEAYRKSCKCSVNASHTTNMPNRMVADFERAHVKSLMYLVRLREQQKEEETIDSVIIARVFSPTSDAISHYITPAMAITMLQHFAYHGRLKKIRKNGRVATS